MLVVKNSPTKAGDVRDSSLTPGSERSPGGGHSNPLQYSCLENLMDGGARWLQSIGSQRVSHDWATASMQGYKDSTSIYLVTTWIEEAVSGEKQAYDTTSLILFSVNTMYYLYSTENFKPPVLKLYSYVFWKPFNQMYYLILVLFGPFEIFIRLQTLVLKPFIS